MRKLRKLKAIYALNLLKGKLIENLRESWNHPLLCYVFSQNSSAQCIKEPYRLFAFLIISRYSICLRKCFWSCSWSMRKLLLRFSPTSKLDRRYCNIICSSITTTFTNNKIYLLFRRGRLLHIITVFIGILRIVSISIYSRSRLKSVVLTYSWTNLSCDTCFLGKEVKSIFFTCRTVCTCTSRVRVSAN